MTDKPSTTLAGTVDKIIKSPDPSEPDHDICEIDAAGARRCSPGARPRRAESRPWDLIRFIPAWESEPSTQSKTFEAPTN